MLPETLVFIISMAITGSLLFLLVYFVSLTFPNFIQSIQLLSIPFQVIILSDLECDYLNAQTCCSKLNFWVTPKLGSHAFLAFILLIHRKFCLFILLSKKKKIFEHFLIEYWGLFLLNVPGVAWLIYEKVKIPSGNLGVYDPAEIHNRGMIRKHLRDCMIYLGFYLLIFFVYLY